MPSGSIERADWHYETAEKEYREAHSLNGELRPEQNNQIWLLAADHIGQFLRWIIDRGFEGEDADEDGCKKVRAGELTGPEYLMEYCDGKLWWSDICEELHPFVKAYYYDETGEYLDDYGACCLPDLHSFFNVNTKEEDYKKLREKIDERYAAYRNAQH